MVGSGTGGADALVLAEGQDEVLDGDKVVAHGGPADAGLLDEGLEVATEHLLRAAAHLRLPGDETIDEADRRGGVDASLGQDAEREGVLLLEHGLAQVLGLDDLLLRVGGDLRRQYDRFPRALGELVLRDLLGTVRGHAGRHLGAKRARGTKPAEAGRASRSHRVAVAADGGRDDATARDGRGHGRHRDPRHTRAREVSVRQKGVEGSGWFGVTTQTWYRRFKIRCIRFLLVEIRGGGDPLAHSRLLSL